MGVLGLEEWVLRMLRRDVVASGQKKRMMSIEIWNDDNLVRKLSGETSSARRGFS